MEFLQQYGLFLAQTVTLLIAVLIVIVVATGLGQRGRRLERGHIEVRSLNEAYDGMMRSIKQAALQGAALKQELKAEKKTRKAEEKARKKQAKSDDPARRPRLYVLDFEGDIQASSVKQLRQEVTAVLSVVEDNDEVMVRIESAGGQVHGYGLAASQLSRITGKGVHLTVSVDKVAASGGYMMACIADRVLAAPFAILGSIGVVAQLPNFHRFLENRDVDYEIFTAGEYKRTVTVFGENTEQGRQKFTEELEDVHTLFKEFVAEHRAGLDVDKVSTGEAWYGKRALEHHLCDELKTSDEYLVERCETCDVFQIRYVEDKTKIERVVDRFSGLLKQIQSRHSVETPGGRPFLY